MKKVEEKEKDNEKENDLKKETTKKKKSLLKIFDDDNLSIDEKMTRMKKISKCIFVLSKIGYVFTIIALCGIILGALLTPLAIFGINEYKTNPKMKVVETTYEIDEEDAGDEDAEEISNEEDEIIKEEIEEENNIEDLNDKEVNDNNVDNKDADDKFAQEAKEDILTLYIGLLKNDNNLPTWAMIALCELLLMLMALNCYVYKKLFDCICKLFNNFITGDSPFTKSNVRAIKDIAKLMLIGLVLSTITESASSLSISYSSIIMLLVIFALSHIFDYGYELQKESDETL